MTLDGVAESIARFFTDWDDDEVDLDPVAAEQGPEAFANQQA